MILTINGGSSTVKYAGYGAGGKYGQLFKGKVEGRGEGVVESIQSQIGERKVLGIGHRVVHPGLKLRDHCVIDHGVMAELRAAVRMDLAHLPGEIELIEQMGTAFPGVPQVACLDTAVFKGMAGVSDMRTLLAARDTDKRAAEAVEMFCRQAKKFIGAYAAVMGGLDALVFSGGIGENSPEIRAEICAGLEFLGIEIYEYLNR